MFKPAAALLLIAALLIPSGARASDMASLMRELPMYALSLLGTPYRYGGKQPDSGFDCSGFVWHVFDTTAGLTLPSSSREISQKGRPLQPEELQPGDLVFFNTLGRAFSHVGIYIGENRFVHSTSSQTGKVMISSLDERYWSQRYDGARRMVESTPEISVSEKPPPQSTPADSASAP